MLLLIQLPCKQIKAQLTISWVDSLSLNADIKYLAVDNQQQIFTITPGNEIRKYNWQGNAIANFRQRVSGDIAFIDVSNPLKLFTFYNQSNIVLQFDNMLNPINQIRLNQLALGTKSVICRSFDNNFWMYDERSFRLIKFALDLQQLINGEWLQNRIETDFAPHYLVEAGEKIFLIEKAKGIYVFDLYGIFLYKLPYQGVTQLKHERNFIYFLQNELPFALDLSNPVSSPIPLSKEKFTGIAVSNHFLYLSNAKTIHRFKISNN